MTNEQIIEEIKRLRKEMKRLYAEDKLNERNKLVERYRALRVKADYGYRVGDVVLKRHGNGRKEDRIIAISDNWQISFKNEEMPVESIRPIKETQDQMDIFEMGC
ncbi:hypothetical protein HMI01_11080 [Halolactibacillus miurensis]|uniref:Uncharacterized protein n=1 Tax=Halolactibacillus miurensis TaxID=306541 RepID=A0A1I6SGW9_9BACI|nr:hypothetical protein [Halolactibacillus miurensis]GEM04120.1 hypothetical protein HMI01_11080 [Halolactibacillus miurensis]SFS76090.1 hypothetical protein SAMN05421668_10935 [Halolactibacillus miurensis]